ncbi:replication protein A 70 kDa DNA-binding subunit B [Tanacetum coccineum]
MFRFELLFQEGQCYVISNFVIVENSGKLPLLPHKYKISFYKGTVVTRIDSFDNNVNGFILEPFNRLLDGTRQYHKHEAVVPIQSADGRKIRRTVIVEDSESNQLDYTFWDQWANMWDEYALKRDELGHVVFILQLGKVKYWDGTPSIHNALFGTKMFINRDLPKILSFWQRLKELPEYDESQFKISLFTPQKPVVTIAEFFNGAVKKMVSRIHECDQKSYCIVYARIHRIHKENGWAYTAYKECNKKVNVVESKAMSSAGKSKVAFYRKDHGAVQVASRLVNQSIERDRLIGIGFVLDFVEFISFTYGDKEMISVIEAVSR